MTLLDVRVFKPNSKRNVNQNLKKTYEINKKERKIVYNERVQEIEHGSFGSIVMSATGGMARECSKFYSRLSEMIDEKRDQPCSVIAVDTQKNIFYSYQEYWHGHPRKQISDAVKGSTKINNNAVASEAISNIVLV